MGTGEGGGREPNLGLLFGPFPPVPMMTGSGFPPVGPLVAWKGEACGVLWAEGP